MARFAVPFIAPATEPDRKLSTCELPRRKGLHDVDCKQKDLRASRFAFYRPAARGS